jgi:hypothetical protein
VLIEVLELAAGAVQTAADHAAGEHGVEELSTTIISISSQCNNEQLDLNLHGQAP